MQVNKNLFNRIFSGAGFSKNYKPKVGSVRLGDLRRTAPLSRRYGIDRGGAVDRIYIEDFLEKNKNLIKGHVLEVANNDYTLRFGGSAVTKSDILHVNDANQKATIIADLGQPLTISENLFDCIILTQTLQFIYEYEKALENCYRLLKAGGYLLLTVPGITPIGKDPFDWYWSFTSCSIKRLLTEQFAKENVHVQSFGNVLAATAFLYGLGKTEIGKEDMAVQDPSFQVIIAAAARK